MSRFVNKTTLTLALDRLYGTAGHLLKVWFVLKHMGLSVDAHPVEYHNSQFNPST